MHPAKCALRAVAVLTVASLPVACSSAMDYDFSSPASSFSALQRAAATKDLKALYEIYYRTDGLGPLEDFVRAAERRGQRFWKPLGLLAEAEVLRIERTAANDEYSAPHARIWWKSADGAEMGLVVFGLQNKEWKWIPAGSGGPFHWKAYDFTTPTNAAASLSTALQEEIFDVPTVYGAISVEVRSGLALDKYTELLRKRKAAAEPRFVNPFLHARFFEVSEMNKEESACQVRVFDAEHRSLGTERFARTGKEWKWVPDPKSVWRVGDP